MSNNNPSLNIGDNIRLNRDKFTVEGYIVFEDSEGSRWTEYKIRSKEKSQVQWLSIDKLNNEYAVYNEKSYSEEFLEENIKANGYKKVDGKWAKVLDYKGNVDVDLGEKVFCEEYEDSTEKLLISIENWDGEQEFSKGYYVDKNDIEKIEVQLNNYNSSILHEINKEDNSKKYKTNIKIVLAIISVIVIILISLRACSANNRDLSKFIKSNSNFQYETSITSDLDQSKKADVYFTNSTIEEAAKSIIAGVKGNIKDVQENQEDGTVVIMTEDELALVYLSKDSKTLVQVSSREYVYSSRTTVYSGSSSTNNYYRSYYYYRGYSQDQSRYKDLKNGYSDYKSSTSSSDSSSSNYKSGNFSSSSSNSDYKSGNFSPSNSNSDYKSGNFSPNNSNKYRIYSDSIRQSSVNSRSSSGDGISSGK